MTVLERKKMIINAIRTMEDRLAIIKYCYDGVKGPEQRDREIEHLQKHLHCAHSVLVMINEEEIEQLSTTSSVPVA